jgi:hypothetical protein
MPRKNPVREWLKARGCPEQVVKGGLAGLVSAWERTAANVVRGYDLGMDDYLNDMDGREILQSALAVASVFARRRAKPKIQAADLKIQASLGPAGQCLWGEREAKSRGWTPEINWWYFRLPKGVRS